MTTAAASEPAEPVFEPNFLASLKDGEQTTTLQGAITDEAQQQQLSSPQRQQPAQDQDVSTRPTHVSDETTLENPSHPSETTGSAITSSGPETVTLDPAPENPGGTTADGEPQEQRDASVDANQQASTADLAQQDLQLHLQLPTPPPAPPPAYPTALMPPIGPAYQAWNDPRYALPPMDSYKPMYVWDPMQMMQQQSQQQQQQQSQQVQSQAQSRDGLMQQTPSSPAPSPTVVATASNGNGLHPGTVMANGSVMGTGASLGSSSLASSSSPMAAGLLALSQGQNSGQIPSSLPPQAPAVPTPQYGATPQAGQQQFYGMSPYGLPAQYQQQQGQLGQANGTGGYMYPFHQFGYYPYHPSQVASVQPFRASNFAIPSLRRATPYSTTPKRSTPSLPARQMHPTRKGVYEATYSNVTVYEVTSPNGVGVMRRKTDSWINATHILKAAGMEKSRRTKVLEREVHKGEHEKIQGGYGKYQGTWIPLYRAKTLAAQYGLSQTLHDILDIPE